MPSPKWYHSLERLFQPAEALSRPSLEDCGEATGEVQTARIIMYSWIDLAVNVKCDGETKKLSTVSDVSKFLCSSEGRLYSALPVVDVDLGNPG